MLQALKARSCTNIIVSEVSAKRKEFALAFGADAVLDPTSDDIVARCRELCDGRGPHLVFDCAGVQAGLDQAILAVRARGAIVNIAVWEKPFVMNANPMLFRERRWLGVATYLKGDFEEVIAAIAAGKMPDVGKMITKRIGLGEVVEGGFETLVREKDRQVKILVRAGSGAEV